MERHSGPYSLVQKIGKLSSVAPGEQCTCTLRSCRNHMHDDVQKPWKVHVNIIVLPVTLYNTDVDEHLYRYGSFPPLVDCKMGLLVIYPKTQLQGRYSTK